MSRHMKNSELLSDANIKALVDEGRVVLIDKVPTKKEGFTNLYFIAQVKGVGASDVSAAQAMLLDWENSSTIMRCMENAANKVADTMELGSALSPELALRVVDSLNPMWQGHTARQTKEGKALLHEGKPIYRQTQLVTKDELAIVGHQLLKAVVAEAAAPPVANKLLAGKA